MTWCIVGTHYATLGTGCCWNTQFQQWEQRLLFEYFVAPLVTEVIVGHIVTAVSTKVTVGS
jgi:hypothetical protein